MTCPVDEDSNCLANATKYTDDDGFFKCLWNEKTEPTKDYIFFLVNGGTTTLLNGIVLVIAFLYIDTRSKPSQIFVINMTAGDLLVGFTFQFTRPFAPCFPTYFCGPYYVMAWMCQMGSMFNLLFLNLDKFLAIRIPLRYHVIVTRRRVTALVILCWVVLFIISLLSYTFFLQFRNPLNPSCIRVNFNPEEYYAFLTIIAYVGPTICSFAISAYIFIIAQASSKLLGSARKRQRKMLMQRVFFVFSSTMWTFITCLPYRIGYTIYTFCVHAMARAAANTVQFSVTQMTPKYVYTFTNLTTPIDNTPSYGTKPDQCMGETGIVAMTYVLMLLKVGTIGNPIITIITQRQYRRRVVAAWRSVAMALHLPPWCYPKERREIITEARSTPLNSPKVIAGIRNSANMLFVDQFLATRLHQADDPKIGVCTGKSDAV